MILYWSLLKTLIVMKNSTILLLIVIFNVLFSCERTDLQPKPDSYLEYLSDKTILSIEIYNNKIWIASSKYCDTCYIHPASSAIPTIEQLTVVENSTYEYEEGTIFGTPRCDNAGNLYVANSMEIYKVNNLNDYSLFLETGDFRFKSFVFDKDDNIWFSGYNGIAFWDKTELVIYNSNNSELPTVITHGLAIDKSGVVWIALDFKGLLKIDSDKWEIIPNNNIPGLTSLSYLRSPIVDADNNIWFEVFVSNKTSNIVMYNGTDWEYQYPDESGNGKFHGNLSIDSKGRIWSINTFFEYGTNILSGSSLSFRNNGKWVTLDASDIETRILDVNANDNKIFIGTVNGLFEKNY